VGSGAEAEAAEAAGCDFIIAQGNEAGGHIRALISAESEDSVRTTRFEVECGLCPSTHGIPRSAIENADAFQGDVVGEVEIAGEKRQIRRFQGMPPSKAVSGTVPAMACYAGQSVGSVKRVQPAAEIVAELFDGADALLRRWARRRPRSGRPERAATRALANRRSSRADAS
jgi:NAD(P)H-dependent flavin oxidoreductase YrpB (nitropropane dioxygenase family)